MEQGAIPLFEIYAYMQIFEINCYDQRQSFLRHIRYLDKVYLDFIREKDQDKDKK